MKRHPALQDLSRDHHLVLRYCQRIRRAVAANARNEEVGELVQEFLAFYRTDMLPHFQEEDGYVVPIAQSMGSRTLAAAARRVLDDHVWFRGAMAELARRFQDGAPLMGLLAELEPRLTNHVRMEESELFEASQNEVSDDILRNMWAASYVYRSKHRVPSACTVRPHQKIKKS